MSLLVTASLSALFAGLVAILVTVAVERWGGVVGGLVGTLPTTIVPAAVGIWVTSPSEGAFAVAMYAVPVGMLIDVLFLWLWRVVPDALPAGRLGARLATTLLLTLAAWFVAATGAVVLLGWLGGRATGQGGVAWVLTASIFGIGLVATWRPRHAPRGSRAVGPWVLVARGVLAAVAIAASVLIAEAGGLAAAGIASVFPAIFITTMVGLWLAQGESVPGGAVGPMMVGATSVPAFACAAALLYPLLGPGLGTVVAWLVAVAGITLPGFGWIRWRQRGVGGGA